MAEEEYKVEINPSYEWSEKARELGVSHSERQHERFDVHY